VLHHPGSLSRRPAAADAVIAGAACTSGRLASDPHSHPPAIRTGGGAARSRAQDRHVPGRAVLAIASSAQFIVLLDARSRAPGCPQSQSRRILIVPKAAADAVAGSYPPAAILRATARGGRSHRRPAGRPELAHLRTATRIADAAGARKYSAIRAVPGMKSSRTL